MLISFSPNFFAKNFIQFFKKSFSKIYRFFEPLSSFFMFRAFGADMESPFTFQADEKFSVRPRKQA